MKKSTSVRDQEVRSMGGEVIGRITSDGRIQGLRTCDGCARRFFAVTGGQRYCHRSCGVRFRRLRMLEIHRRDPGAFAERSLCGIISNVHRKRRAMLSDEPGKIGCSRCREMQARGGIFLDGR